MGLEYKIVWNQPQGYNPGRVLRKLPSPISSEFKEIYNDSVEDYGFYFVDHQVDKNVASMALRLFIDEALAHGDVVKVTEA